MGIGGQEGASRESPNSGTTISYRRARLIQGAGDCIIACMVDNLTPEKRSKIMRSIRSQHTKPEMQVRRLVHSMGYRYRLHSKHLAGRPDLVFPNRRSVIFVHGCFWHMHESCAISHIPQAKGWSTKLLANKSRDQRTVEQLRAEGWNVLIIWECELADITTLQNIITAFLN